MTTFLAAKARRLVDEAIQRLPSPVDQQLWNDWSRSHPEVKRWNDNMVVQDNMPTDVALVAMRALSLFATQLEGDINSRTSDDDELVQLDNVLAYIRLIESTLGQAVH